MSSVEMSDIYSKSSLLPSLPSSSSSASSSHSSHPSKSLLLTSSSSKKSKHRGNPKFTKHSSVIERSSRDSDLLRRQQSVELGGRRQKVTVPNRSYSLNSRFSSSTGHLHLLDPTTTSSSSTTASASVFAGVSTSIKGRRASNDPTFNVARCVNWAVRDDATNNNNNNTHHYTGPSSSSYSNERQLFPTNFGVTDYGGGGSNRNSFIMMGTLAAGGDSGRSSLAASQTDVAASGGNGSGGGGKQRQMSIVLNMPSSRQASLRSQESGRSVSTSTGAASRANSTKNRPSVSYGNSGLPGPGQSGRSGSKCGVDMMMMRKESRSDSILPFGVSLKDLPEKERRHRKVAFAVILFSSFLLISAILCIIVSLHRSTHIDEKQRILNLQYALDKQPPSPSPSPSSPSSPTPQSPVRKENEHLLKVIHQPASSLNVTNNNNDNNNSSSTTATLLQSDTNNVSHNNNNNNYLINSNNNNHNHHSVHSTSSNSNYDSISNSQSNGQSLPRTTDMAEEAAQDPHLSLYHSSNNNNNNDKSNHNKNFKMESGQLEAEKDKTEFNSQPPPPPPPPQHSSTTTNNNNHNDNSRRINNNGNKGIIQDDGTGSRGP